MCALLQANPGLRGIVLDLPEVVEDTGELWAAKLGLQERCRYVAGDMWRSCISREAQCDENREEVERVEPDRRLRADVAVTVPGPSRREHQVAAMHDDTLARDSRVGALLSMISRSALGE